MTTKRSSKKTPQKRRKAPASNPVPGWVWIFGISAFFAFAGFLYYLATVPPSQPSAAKAPERKQEVRPVKEQPKPAPVKPKAEPKKEEKKKEDAKTQEDQRFKFYEMLPQTEVVPPHVDEYQTAKERDLYHYTLQTGSFRTAEDAERQRALIAFQGMKGSVDQITSSDGTKWYRVHIGPFTTRSSMNKAVDKLVAINIQPLVKKAKQDAKPQGQ